MLDIRENFEIVEKIVLKYLSTNDDEYTLYDENNVSVNREKLIKTLHRVFFDDPTNQIVLEVMREYLLEYGHLPSVVDIKNIIRIKNHDVAPEELDAIFSTSLDKHGKRFVYDYIKAFTLVGNLNLNMNSIMARLKTEMIDPSKLDEVYEYVRTEIGTNLAIDFTNSKDGLSVLDPKAHIQEVKKTKSTGFPFLDRVLGGGWEPKTLIVFAGRPKVGKSLVLANIAVRAVLRNLNTGVATVELGDTKYMKRIGSNLLNIDYELYKDLDDPRHYKMLEKRLDDFSKLEGMGALHLQEFPTGTVSSIDIENYFLREEQKTGKKFDLIIVDYINLLRPFKADSTLYEKIKKIAEELRAIAQRNNWCVVTATQIKPRDYNSDIILDSIAESSGLVATVDSLFGIMGEPGGIKLTLKNIANRDEGYMMSRMDFIKHKKYFRLREDMRPSAVMWVDESNHEDEIDFQEMVDQLEEEETVVKYPFAHLDERNPRVKPAEELLMPEPEPEPVSIDTDGSPGVLAEEVVGSDQLGEVSSEVAIDAFLNEKSDEEQVEPDPISQPNLDFDKEAPVAAVTNERDNNEDNDMSEPEDDFEKLLEEKTPVEKEETPSVKEPADELEAMLSDKAEQSFEPEPESEDEEQEDQADLGPSPVDIAFTHQDVLKEINLNNDG